MISVVIPLYNKGAYIKHAIESVLAQTNPDWVLWVVDDGSTDNSVQVVRQFQDARIHLVQQANRGVSAARNTGTERAASEWVAFLDADDFWAPGHIDNLLAASNATPNAVFCATAYNVVNESGQSRCIRLPSALEGQIGVISDYFSHVLTYEHPVHSSAMMVRRTVLNQVGGFPLNVTQGEDLIVWSRLACLGPLAYSGTATASYVAPPVSAENRRQAVRRPQIPDPVGKALTDLLVHKPHESLRYFLADWYRIRAMLFMECNERLNSLDALYSAARTGRVKMRDMLSVGLILLPSSMRQWALAMFRRNRGKA